jgi:hypothetical protein
MLIISCAGLPHPGPSHAIRVSATQVETRIELQELASEGCDRELLEAGGIFSAEDAAAANIARKAEERVKRDVSGEFADLVVAIYSSKSMQPPESAARRLKPNTDSD